MRIVQADTMKLLHRFELSAIKNLDTGIGLFEKARQCDLII